MSKALFHMELNDRKANKRYQVATCWDNDGRPSLQLVTEEKADEGADRFPSMAFEKAIAIASERLDQGAPRGFINIKVRKGQQLALVDEGAADDDDW